LHPALKNSAMTIANCMDRPAIACKSPDAVWATIALKLDSIPYAKRKVPTRHSLTATEDEPPNRSEWRLPSTGRETAVKVAASSRTGQVRGQVGNAVAAREI
jgi:hypothetical protein